MGDAASAASVGDVCPHSATGRMLALVWQKLQDLQGIAWGLRRDVDELQELLLAQPHAGCTPSARAPAALPDA